MSMRAPVGFACPFWLGGFEGADHLNRHGVALDMADSTGHVELLDADYARAVALGLGGVRESIGWRLAESQPLRFDLARAVRIATRARQHGLQVLWTLMHYGTPPDLSLFDDALIDRFARFAAEVARVLAPLHDTPPVYNLINEIGFVAWTATETDRFHPYRSEAGGSDGRSEVSGYALKRRLVRAVLAGIDAVRQVDPRARFLHVEPVVHVVAPSDRPDLAPLAQQVRGYQWQAWDLIAGRLEPELGGSVEALDVIGINHYHSGQWEAGTELRLEWHTHDPRRLPLATLLQEVWQRYRRPLLMAETSHIGSGRADWLNEVATEVRQALRDGVPVAGLCLYPLVDRHDWDDPAHWHHSGLWDAGEGRVCEPTQRLLRADYAAALRHWQRVLPLAGPSGAAAC